MEYQLDSEILGGNEDFNHEVIWVLQGWGWEVEYVDEVANENWEREVFSADLCSAVRRAQEL